LTGYLSELEFMEFKNLQNALQNSTNSLIRKIRVQTKASVLDIDLMWNEYL